MNSTHKCEVAEVILQPHPNADTLSIATVFGGYTCCVRTADWKPGDRGVFIPPDSLVDTRLPEFAFLADGKKDIVRIKAKKLRGINSYGLLLKAPVGAYLGDDLSQLLCVTHYEPPEELTIGGECVSFPYVDVPIYDVDSFQRYASSVFIPGEAVVATEKVHGTNFRSTYRDGQYFVGSHRQ